MLTPERRRQLDDIVLKMGSQNAPQADVQAVVNDFVGKYNNETQLPTTQTPEKTFLQKTGDVASDLVKGVVKGAGSSLAGASQLGEKLLLRPLDKILPGQRMTSDTQAGVQGLGIDKALEPTNTVQKIGFGAEQVGEFFAPAGLVGKVGKVAEGASKLQKAGAVATKVGAEALSAGGVTALQSGELNKNVATNVAIAGAIPVVGKAVDVAAVPVKKFLSENIAPRIVNSILKPVSKEFNFGRNAGAGVVEEGITAKTRGELLKKITAKKEAIGQEMDIILNAPQNTTKVLDLSKTLSPIDDAMQKAVQSGEQGLFDRLKAIKDGMTKEFSVVEGKITPVGNKNLLVTPAEAKRLKTELGQATKWTGQAFDNDVNQVRVEIYRNIDKMVDKAVPGIDKLNSRYANILSAEKSLDRTIDTIQRQNLVGLKDLGVGAAYGTVQSIGQGNVSPADFLIGFLGSKVAGSTVAKTNLAKALGKLKPEEKTIIAKSVPILKNLIFGLQSQKDNQTKQ